MYILQKNGDELRIIFLDVHFLYLHWMIKPMGGGCPLNRFKPSAIFYVTDRSNAVLLIWFSVVFACFGVSFCHAFTFFVSR